MLDVWIITKVHLLQLLWIEIILFFLTVAIHNDIIDVTVWGK